jgi:hypothetical protein
MRVLGRNCCAIMIGEAMVGSVLNAAGHEGSPAGLMARTDATAGVAVEIFVE